ncbi:hypothetical protein [Pseudomonas nitroreducens]|uniref:Uncharacterized protein n=1 Tax=Pseudomonas nitroreducens TaxID=46680 RepID=A0A6G6J9G4_PSENT|nr:hypothetical protein [Pseudomonas nitroreducens]QIE91121.1 hypothetical protein G5B91_32715 [Pseudomonas nitroreducens]
MQKLPVDPTSSRSSLLDCLATLAWHSWAILRFKHKGEGLGKLTRRQHAWLIIVATLVVVAATYLAPGIKDAKHLVLIGLWFVALTMLVKASGPRALEGWTCLFLVTEPICLVLRYLPAGGVLDQVLGAWVLGAGIFFVWRCDSRKGGAGRGQA